jgi:hypothetical protein
MSISRAQSGRRQPARKTFLQRRRTGKLTGVAARYTSRVFLLAAFLWLSCLPCAFARSSQAFDSTFPTSPLKTRVVGFDELPSCLFLLEADQTRETATGSNGCDCEHASGLQRQPNRDPIGEEGTCMVLSGIILSSENARLKCWTCHCSSFRALCRCIRWNGK